jgi:hypothetical protein
LSACLVVDNKPTGQAGQNKTVAPYDSPLERGRGVLLYAFRHGVETHPFLHIASRGPSREGNFIITTALLILIIRPPYAVKLLDYNYILKKP